MPIKALAIGAIILVCIRLAFCGESESAAGNVDTVVFDYIDGRVRPVMLFKDGWATTDSMALLSDNLDKLKAQQPGAWRTWRRESGKVQLRWGDNWKDIAWNNDYAPPLPDDYRLAGRFSKSGGIGSVRTSSTYTFFEDGTFTTGGSVAVNHTNHLSGANTGIYSIPEDQRGHYRINLYQLELTFDDGNSVQKSLVISEGDITEPEVIYINGQYYVK